MNRTLLAGACALATLALAGPASAGVMYNFSFTGGSYTAIGNFTTGAADAANDGSFNITALNGMLSSLNPALSQGAFHLAGAGSSSGANTTLLSPDGASTYSNLYNPVLKNFTGGGFLADGATFEVNGYNGIFGNYAACTADCLSVKPNQGLYDPGDIGKLKITPVPEPKTWLIMLAGLAMTIGAAKMLGNTRMNGRPLAI